ncbi:phage tail sheath family protein [Paenibacillus sanguinis]|uniref:phage tail sheath family protein n=1 Tax=Paenibacillus sanguinis TaxID=225906 RepID=UPI000380099A|nr:phage tail sheath family protein [Paenibacillus sanguinis]
MAGGTWTTQNKVRPGVYINFESVGSLQTGVGERGTVTFPLALSWGPSKSLILLQAGEDVSGILGYDLSAPELLPVREALKRASTLLLYRLNTGTPATVTVGELTATAKYGGLRGNDLSIIIQESLDVAGSFEVRTLLEGREVDKQTAADIAALAANDWITFSGTGDLEATAGAPLAGGADGTVTNADHTAYLGAIEVQEFNTVGLLSSDAALKAVYTAWIKRQREDEGKMIQLVLPDYPAADYEGVISVKNGVVLADTTKIDKVQAVAWVAGATAGAAVNASLTYQAYDDAVDVDIRYTNSQIIAALRAGEFLFVPSQGRALVEQDINTLTSFTPIKGRERSKNRVIRVLDGLATDFKSTFERFYLGKISNNADGRGLLRAELTNIITNYQGIGAIQNFNSQTDLNVLAGSASDSVYVEMSVQPVDSVEKIYMRIKVV